MYVWNVKSYSDDVYVQLECTVNMYVNVHRVCMNVSHCPQGSPQRAGTLGLEAL